MPTLRPVREPSAQELDSEARAAGMAQVLGSLAMEGLTPSPDVQTLTQKFVSGEITLDEMGEAIFAKHGVPFHK